MQISATAPPANRRARAQYDHDRRIAALLTNANDDSQIEAAAISAHHEDAARHARHDDWQRCRVGRALQRRKQRRRVRRCRGHLRQHISALQLTLRARLCCASRQLTQRLQPSRAQLRNAIDSVKRHCYRAGTGDANHVTSNDCVTSFRVDMSFPDAANDAVSVVHLQRDPMRTRCRDSRLRHSLAMSPHV
jgi:hypothetical protein